MRWFCLLSLFTALLLGPPAPNQSAQAAPEASLDQTLRVPVLGKIETLDPPRAASEGSRLAIVNLFDQLFEYHHLRRPLEVIPSLAAALPEISEDGKQHTFRLRQGITYQPDACLKGAKPREVTAGDVAFCIKRLMDAHTKSPGQWMLTGKIVGLDAFVAASAKVKPESHRGAYRVADGYPVVSGLEILDDHTLRIHLIKPMPELPWLLAGAWFSIYPPEAVRFYGAKLGSRAVATGPYRVVMFLNKKRLVLRANPRYRSEVYPTPSGGEGTFGGTPGTALPANEVVEMTAFDSELKIWQAFLNGDVDYAQVPRDAFLTSVDVSNQTLLPHLAKRGAVLRRTPRPEIYYDGFNMQDPVIGAPAGAKGLAIRRAICLAVDDTYALTRLYTNLSERVYGPILPEFRGFDPDFGNEWTRYDDEARADSLETARALLTEAGFPGGEGIPVLRMHTIDDETSRRLVGFFKKQVAEIGIKLESVAVTWPVLQDTLRAGKAQIFTSSWYADYPDAQNFLQMFYGPNAREPNYTGYASKEFDALYDEARRLPSDEDPSAIYEEMQDVVTQDCPWRYRFRRIRWSAVHTWLGGHRNNEFAPKFFKYCSVDAEARAKALENWK